MSEYNSLVNLRFNRTFGPIDLNLNNWNSKISTDISTVDTVDYSTAGQFAGNCATFDGSTSALYKVSGDYILFSEDDDFTISLWINADITTNDSIQMILSDGSNESSCNKIYIRTEDNRAILVVADRTGVTYGVDITDSFSNNRWNYLAIIKTNIGFSNKKLGVFLNGDLVGNYLDIENAINFDLVRATFGTGYDDKYNRRAFFKGRLDDIVFLKEALTITDDTVPIPTNYLIASDDEEDQNVWEDKETEYSRYASIVESLERRRHRDKHNTSWIQEGFIPKKVDIAWRQVEELYFKNGEYFVNRDRNSIKIHMFWLWDNNFFVNSKEVKYMEVNYANGVKNKQFMPAILFVDGTFIPWENLTVVKSDKFVTFVIKGFKWDHMVSDIQMIILPFAVKYSNSGLVPDNGFKIFGADKTCKTWGHDYVISCLNPNLRMLVYENVKNISEMEVEFDIKNKLTASNFLIFYRDSFVIPDENDVSVDISIGNYMTLIQSDPTKALDVYIFFDIRHIKSEDNLAEIPNEKAIKKYVESEYEYSIGSIPIDTSALRQEFDYFPTYNPRYDDKYYNTMRYIFNYNRNKYDEVYEEIKPVNNIQFTGKEILALKDRDGKITMSRDIYDKFDTKNDTFPIIFVDGELPVWYQNIEYTNYSFTFEPGNTIKNNSIVEVCYFRNICNELFDTDIKKLHDNGYFNENNEFTGITIHNRYYYIPKEDLLVYTDRKNYLNLCPILYNVNEETSKIELSDEKYENYGLYIGSKRQFLYRCIEVYDDTTNVPLPYTFRSGYNPDKYLVFLNGRLMNNSFYKILVPSLSDNRITAKTIYFVKSLKKNDRLEIFYISETCDSLNTSGDLVIKPIKVQCTETNQRKFLIPLPYSNYPIDYDTFIVMNKSLRMSTDKYKITSTSTTQTITVWNEDTGTSEEQEIVVTNYYIEFMDQDDYLIPGEEVVFIFPYYKAEWETIDEPTTDNTLQFVTRYVKVTSDNSTIRFPSDYTGNINDSKSIYIFENTSLVDPSEYVLADNNTIEFNHILTKGTEVAMVIETDRYNFADNNIILNFSNVVISEYGQLSVDLYGNTANNSYIFFKNNKLLDADSYTVYKDKLVLDRNQDDLVPGDVITSVYAIDGANYSNSVNFQSYTITAVMENIVDIPNYTNMRYSDSNILVFVNNEYIPNAYYYVSGNTIYFKDNAYTTIIYDPLYAKTYPRDYIFINPDWRIYVKETLPSNRGGKIVNVNDEVTVLVAYKAMNPDTIDYHLGNKEYIRFTEKRIVATTGQMTFDIPYPALVSTPFRDNKFLLFIRGIFIPEDNYSISNNNLKLTIDNTDIKLKAFDELTFLFCHAYDLTDVNKSEFTIALANGQHSFTFPSVYTSSIDLSDRVLVFYGGTYIDSSRYIIDRLTRTMTLKDIPGENDSSRKVSVVFLYTGLKANGSIAMLPQSGYICLNEHYIDRNYNKELMMIFVNGKKVPKNYIMDITNSIKKINVDIKTGYDLVALSTSPLITEFKEFYDERENRDRYRVKINKITNGVIQVTCNNEVYYKDFEANYGDYFVAKCIPDKGYVGGTISVNGDSSTYYGNVFSDIEIDCSAPVLGAFRTISITQSDDQFIKVSCNGTDYNTTFNEIKGSTFTVQVTCGREGYHSGTVTITGAANVRYDSTTDTYTGTINNSNITISVSNAIIDTVPFTVLDENLYAQKLEVEFYDRNNVLITKYETPGNRIEVEYGLRMKFSLKSTDPRFVRGQSVGPFKINKFYSVDYSYPLDNLIPDAVSPVKKFYIDIVQNKNEVVYVDTYLNPELMDRVSRKTRHIEPFYASNNEKYEIGVEAYYGYTAGRLSSSNGKLSGEVDSTFKVTATPAILDTVIFNIVKERLATGSITAKLNTGEIVGSGSYIVQKNSIVVVTVSVNGQSSIYNVTTSVDRTVTLKNDNSIEFDPVL